MARRRGARRIALEVLYEHEVSGRAVGDILERCSMEPSFEFAGTLVRGVEERRADLDQVLSRYAHEWPVSRMPAIDRNLLRLGALEILYLPDIPPAVTINEAVELAKRYSTQNSSRFVNGVLGQIAEQEASRI
ncbi:MAG: transcription antitermination factor NusB [Actinomycetota bacterium]